MLPALWQQPQASRTVVEFGKKKHCVTLPLFLIQVGLFKGLSAVIPLTKRTGKWNNYSPSISLILSQFFILKSTAIGFARNPRQFNVRRIPTVTITHVFTVTKITNVGVVCAKLVNVTGQCNRRRRGFWLREDEEPIILSFDDDVNRAIDILYTPTLK